MRALFDGTHEAIRTLGLLAATLGPAVAAAARVRGGDRPGLGTGLAADWKSMRFGRRLWVCPTAAEPAADPDAVVVRLDPGPRLRHRHAPDDRAVPGSVDALPLRGRSVIDYGCGSGILAHCRAEARGASP